MSKILEKVSSLCLVTSYLVQLLKAVSQY